MNKKLKTALVLLMMVFALSGIWLLGSSGVQVVIHNVGTETMRSVIVHVTGHSYPIGNITPGTNKSVKVSATGESHIELEQANQNSHVIDCYFESSYKGKIIVEATTNRIVDIKNEIKY